MGLIPFTEYHLLEVVFWWASSAKPNQDKDYINSNRILGKFCLVVWIPFGTLRMRAWGQRYVKRVLDQQWSSRPSSMDIMTLLHAFEGDFALFLQKTRRNCHDNVKGVCQIVWMGRSRERSVAEFPSHSFTNSLNLPFQICTLFWGSVCHQS
jgi:hypothetical protein